MRAASVAFAVRIFCFGVCGNPASLNFFVLTLVWVARALRKLLNHVLRAGGSAWAFACYFSASSFCSLRISSLYCAACIKSSDFAAFFISRVVSLMLFSSCFLLM